MTRLTEYERDKLPLCCQLRHDWYKKIEDDQKEKMTVNQHLKKVKGEYYRHFQALLIGNTLYENMGKKTCLECLHFRHKAVNYYENLHSGKFDREFDEEQKKKKKQRT